MKILSQQTPSSSSMCSPSVSNLWPGTAARQTSCCFVYFKLALGKYIFIHLAIFLQVPLEEMSDAKLAHQLRQLKRQNMINEIKALRALVSWCNNACRNAKHFMWHVFVIVSQRRLIALRQRFLVLSCICISAPCFRTISSFIDNQYSWVAWQEVEFATRINSNVLHIWIILSYCIIFLAYKNMIEH